MLEGTKTNWLKTPVTYLGQHNMLTVSIDGVVLPSRLPCRPKANAGFGDWLRADTDRRWSGTVVPNEKETEPMCRYVKCSIFLKEYARRSAD